jgi:hypothetical protein
MMSVATTDLSRSTQHLIDSRLDTIDRMLLGRVSRQERLEIVREVEAQIFEQLHERGTEEVTREDVLAVLARQDPPEAYLPEDAGDDRPVAWRRFPSPVAGPAQPAGRRDSRFARASGILGLVALGLVMMAPSTFIIAELMSSAVVLYLLGGGALALALIAGSLGTGLALYSRMAGVWAVTGVVTSALSFLGSFSLLALTLVVLG